MRTKSALSPQKDACLPLKNLVFYGDNLAILQEKIPPESVDLVYLDPPFNSKQDYNVIFKERKGGRSTSQELVFKDTWKWNLKAQQTCEKLIEDGGRLSEVIRAFRTFLGDNDMMAYLAMMAPRLRELHKVLKPTGSLYLHCDPTASHYLKLLLDAIFLPQNFRNEIIWQRTRVAKRQSKAFGKTHDVILLYVKSDAAKFNPQFLPHPESYKKSHYNCIEEKTGKRYGLWDFTQKGEGPPRRFGDRGEIAPPLGKHWIWSQKRIDQGMAEGKIVFTRTGTPRLKRYLDTSKGEYLQDIWTDVFDVNAVATERTGYSTQKPIALLKRIIEASSDEGDWILDPFCGCGTAIEVAEALKRRWIGIDITHLAVAIIKQRLAKFGFQVFRNIKIVGEPVNEAEAEALAKDDKFGFQCWAVGRLGAPPIEHRKGADRGIDGRIYFHDDIGPAKEIVISVKAGEHVGPAFVRELRGVMERERAAMGIFVCLKEPTLEMQREADNAGTYRSFTANFPKLQIITIKDIFANKQLNIPGRLNPYEPKRPASVGLTGKQLRLLP